MKRLGLNQQQIMRKQAVVKPVVCPYCNKEAPWISNEEVYGKRYGKSYMCYWCEPCDAYVGCHQNTRVPLGIMANKFLRQQRMKIHRIIDPLWKSGEYTRKSIYGRITNEIRREFHVGNCNELDCKEILELLPTIFPLTPKID